MEHNSEEQMKLIRHGTKIVAVIEHQREKANGASRSGFPLSSGGYNHSSGDEHDQSSGGALRGKNSG